MPGVSSQVDIIVPVASAPEDARRCIENVLACTVGAFTLVLIDDASGDRRVGALFDELARRGDSRIVLVRNARPAGFAATFNRGIAHSRADAVLLDPSTMVTQGWLDALLRCAASDARIATVTPFSNLRDTGAFACLHPGDGTPAQSDPQRLREAVADAAVPTYPDLPSGSGVCMLLRRPALDAVGGFDPAFDAHEGADVDFCLRAARAGFRNVLADDAFVAHTGQRAGAASAHAAGSPDTGVLARLHPYYAAMAHDHVASDPLRALRDAAQWRFDAAAPAHRVLHVVHDLGGGTEAHVRALIDASPDTWRHYLVTAVGDRWQVEMPREARAPIFAFTRRDDESWRAFVGGIAATFGISLVHVHHLSGSRDGALAALPELGIPYGITIHDLWLACPTVTLTDADDRYCGGVTDTAACARCLAAMPSLSDVDIVGWRKAHAELLSSSAFLIAPSHWASDMLVRYFPHVRGRVDVIAHATPCSREPARGESGAPLCAALLPRDDVPTVAVVGAIGRDKGARRIERLVERARERRARLRFVVIGYLDVQHEPWQSADAMLTVHGRYERGDLAALFAHYRVELVVYPSEGPESFSYTLSEAWQAAMPALVPPIGALAERVAGAQAGWIMTDDEWRDDDRMLDRLLLLLSEAQAHARHSASDHARTALQPTARAMAEATLANYVKALAAPRAARADVRLSNARIRDALGYRPWTAPALPSPAALAPAVVARNGVWRRVALRALVLRRTRVGRLLYRMTPEPVIDALKARLHG